MATLEKTRTKKNDIRDFFVVILQAVALALVIRTLLFQPFNIPSGSMEESLLIGDYLFVSKYSYGYSRYSFPLGLAPISGRIWSEAPSRGDIAVFKLPSDNSTDYIKRVIGLPGDKVQMVNGRLIINGVAVKREALPDSSFEGDRFRGRKRYRETLPGGVSYVIHDSFSGGMLDNTPVYQVPEGHFFMMGDNRDNSSDSRVLSAVGYVPLENFVGRAEIVFFSTASTARFWQVWDWPFEVRWNRIMQGL